MKRILIIGLFTVLINATNLEINNAKIRLPPPFAKVTAGFMEISSKLKKDIKLIRIESDFAEHTEIHNMDMKNNMMRMYQIKNVNIPAKSSIFFAPGGKHIMFINLKEKLKANTKKKLKLFFDNGKKMDVWFKVKKITK